MARKPPGSLHVEFEGMAELEKSLEGFLPKFQNKVLRFAARKGAKIVKEEAKRRAPVGDEDDPHYHGVGAQASPGSLVKSIKVKALPRSRTVTGAQVTIGDKLYTGEEYYSAFQEFGWIHTGSGKTRGVGKIIPPKSFLRGSLYDNDSEVYDVYIREGKTKLDQIAAELLRESGGTKIVAKAKR